MPVPCRFLQSQCRERFACSVLAVTSVLTLNVGATVATAGLRFHEPRSSPVAAGDGPIGMAAADLDGDGDQDLAVADNLSGKITILLNNGSGKFTQSATSPVKVGSAPVEIVPADLDGDR